MSEAFIEINDHIALGIETRTIEEIEVLPRKFVAIGYVTIYGKALDDWYHLLDERMEIVLPERIQNLIRDLTHEH